MGPHWAPSWEAGAPFAIRDEQGDRHVRPRVSTHRVLEPFLDELLRLRLSGLQGQRCRCCTHLVPNRRVSATLLIELDDLHDCLWILLLLQLGNTAFLQKLLPFLWQARKFTRGRVEPDMRKMNGVVGCTDLRSLVVVQERQIEAEDALLRLSRRRPGPPPQCARRSRRDARGIVHDTVAQLVLHALHVESVWLGRWDGGRRGV